jgi:hypothetical protein
MRGEAPEGWGAVTADILALTVDPRQLAGIDAFAKRAGIDRHAAARLILDVGLELLEKQTAQKSS